MSGLGVATSATTVNRLCGSSLQAVHQAAHAIMAGCQDVQIVGGMGVTWEHDIHLYLRRVAQNAAMYGSARRHRFRLADLTGVTS